MSDHLDLVSYFIRHAAHSFSIATSEATVHLPTRLERWHVTRGPFVHDKSKEVFERRTHRRGVQIFDAGPEEVARLEAHVNVNLPAGVEMRVQRYDWVGEAGALDLEALEKELEAVVKVEEEEFQRRLSATLGPAAAKELGGEAAAEGGEDGEKDGKQQPPAPKANARKLLFAEQVKLKMEAFIKANSEPAGAKNAAKGKGGKDGGKPKDGKGKK
ncbi:mitochondrial 37S ribosomal protein rsm10 [Irineochytrium annulatum]|nr:mitochondrial 37S ribosomal protein rsm10 [Irineochytrium annulatum]